MRTAQTNTRLTRALLLPVVITSRLQVHELTSGCELAKWNATLRWYEAVKASLAAEGAITAAGAVRIRTAEPVELVVPKAALGTVWALGPPARADDRQRETSLHYCHF